MITYRPKHFALKELVDPETYAKLGDRAWIVLDPRALATLDQLRKRFGSCTVNNWHSGGAHKYRGFRPPQCTVGAALSQHRFGRAFDCSFNTSAHVVREYVLDNWAEFPYLMTLEDEVSWVHFDVRDHGGAGIQLVKP